MNNVQSYMFQLVWEHRKTDHARVLDINVLINWQLSKQGTRWPVSLDRIAGSGVDPSKSSIFLKLSADKLLVFKWLQAQVQVFSKFIWKMLCLCATQLKFWLQTDLGRENSASCYRQGRHEDSWFWLFSPWSRVGHALRPIFMLWLVKIWQVSSCGKFMQHLESCLLWLLKLTEFCVNLWCL